MHRCIGRSDGSHSHHPVDRPLKARETVTYCPMALANEQGLEWLSHDALNCLTKNYSASHQVTDELGADMCLISQ